jgi:hypothetical protein
VAREGFSEKLIFHQNDDMSFVLPIRRRTLWAEGKCEGQSKHGLLEEQQVENRVAGGQGAQEQECNLVTKLLSQSR